MAALALMLAAGPTEVVRFGSDQTEEKRRAAVDALRPDDAVPIHFVVCDIVGGALGPIDSTEHDLHDLLRTRDALDAKEKEAGVRGFSRGWCVRIFRDALGTLYDANGWLDGREVGVCV